MKPLYLQCIFIISRTAWEGLQKPLKTFPSDHILKCAGLCTGIPEECDTIHYDHWHQLCSTAKVEIPSPSTFLQYYFNRLAALLRIITSATRESLKETVPALEREILESMCSKNLSFALTVVEIFHLFCVPSLSLP